MTGGIPIIRWAQADNGLNGSGRLRRLASQRKSYCVGTATAVQRLSERLLIDNALVFGRPARTISMQTRIVDLHLRQYTRTSPVRIVVPTRWAQTGQISSVPSVLGVPWGKPADSLMAALRSVMRTFPDIAMLAYRHFPCSHPWLRSREPMGFLFRGPRSDGRPWNGQSYADLESVFGRVYPVRGCILVGLTDVPGNLYLIVCSESMEIGAIAPTMHARNP